MIRSKHAGEHNDVEQADHEAAPGNKEERLENKTRKLFTSSRKQWETISFFLAGKKRKTKPERNKKKEKETEVE